MNYSNQLNPQSSVSRRRFLIISAGTYLATLATNCAPGQNSSPSSNIDFKTASWDDIVAAASGTTVNWAMWGGSDQINTYVDQWVAQRLNEQYTITLNRVPINDTVEVVNKVVGEVQAGLTEGGSIDLIWINGENFRTMKQGNLLFGPFTDKLPAMQYYNPDNPALTSDFGLAIDGYEAPYTHNYYVMAYDSSKIDRPPMDHQELLAWAKANPGRFTYVAPPAFDGSRFLLTMLYATTGGYEQYAGAEFDQTLWDQNVDTVFAYLNELEPYLWREGSAYPPTIMRLSELMANGEIWMMPAFVGTVAEGLANQQFPSTTQAYAMPGISLSDASFTAIPVNASNPAGGIVLANLLASPEAQLEKFKPSVWGSQSLIDVEALPPEQKQGFTEVEKEFGIALQEMGEVTVPIVNAEYTTQLENAWEERVAG
jgi:putative spermidine/putrescine transport system substrate-binding protein